MAVKTITFGHFLKLLREEKELKIRELARLAQLDQAYIYRLEGGEKSSPSEQVLKGLIRSLKADERRSRILLLLAEQGEVDKNLITLVLENGEIAIEDFESAARASFRENRPKTEEQWSRYINHIRRARETIEIG